MSLLSNDGFADLEAAFAAADAEFGEAPPSDVPEAMPAAGTEAEVVVEQAEADTAEQPEVAETTDGPEVENELQALVDEIAVDAEEAEDDKSEADPVQTFLASDDFWATEIEVDLGDGPEKVTPREMVDSFLKQGDYTRKTQALAEEKSRVSDATEFYRVFEEDPVGFARALAVKANLIEEGAQPVKAIDVAKFTSPEDFEAEIEKRVESRFTEDPRFTEMQASTARSQVNTEFNEIEAERSITLSPELRQHLVDRAVRSGTTDFRQVLDAEMWQRQQARSRADETKRKAPSRPSKGGTVTATPKGEEVVADIDEAFSRALATVGGE